MTSQSPAPSSITAGVWRLSALAALVMLAFLAALYWNLRRVEEIRPAVEHTELIERELSLLGEDLLAAESGQRGFLLTRDEAYLQPYLVARDAAAARLDHLHALIVDDAARDLFDRLVPVVNAKLEELAQTVALARGGEHDRALTVVREGSGRRLMEQFARLRADTLAREQGLIAAHHARTTAGFQHVLLTMVTGGALAIGLMLFFAGHLAKRLNRPIGELMGGIRAMADGALDHRVTVRSDDEVGRIATAFNGMAEHLQAANRVRDLALADLERSNAELDSFAYVASHDLKAPLRGIRNLAQWIGEDIADSASDDTRENLRLLNSRVDRLDSLLESLLTYSRVGRKTSSAEAVNTAALVGEITDYLAPRAGFSVQCEGAMPVLTTPRAPLEQVLRNLINNALKHHDRDCGSVRVSARELGDQVEFRVEDDGPGIPPEFHERVFLMFQTLKPRDQVEGSGMGLAIVRKTVESVRGHIRVEPASSGRGAAFVFSWPKVLPERDRG